MKVKMIIYLACISILGACSTSGEETLLQPVTQAGFQRVTFTRANNIPYSIAVFREFNHVFLYQKTLNTGWTGNGQLTTELPIGNYLFLFALHYGQNTLLSPELFPNETPFNELKFLSQQDPDNEGLILPADELFLPETHADSIYHITASSTIKCTLQRAVCQTLLYIKRGQKTDDGHYLPIAYENNKNILQSLSSIKMNLQQTGTATTVNAVSTGQGEILSDFDLSAPDTLTTEGFAVFKGPFFFPAENNGEITARITLEPATNSPQPVLTSTVTSNLQRNQQFIITIWVTNDWNFINVEADTREMNREIEGIKDIWDDQVN